MRPTMAIPDPEKDASPRFGTLDSPPWIFGVGVSRFLNSGFGFGFRISVWGLGFGVSGFGFRASGFGFRIWISGFGFQVSGFGFRVSGFGFRVLGFGFRDERAGPLSSKHNLFE